MFPISAPFSSQGASSSNSRKPRPSAPSVYGQGYYVGVRISKYETKAQAKARGQGNTGMIHPAVILAGPDANNRYDIATISTEHPDSPPRAPLNAFHPTTTITGEVSFYKRNVAHGDLRPWIDENTGNITQPMSQSQIARLRSHMISQPSPPNGSYFPAAPSPMGNTPYPQPVYGQQYVSHHTVPHPAHKQNVHVPSFPPSNGYMYAPATSQGMAYPYPTPYTVGPDHDGPAPIYSGQDSTYHWYPPTNSGGKSVQGYR